MMKGNRGIVIQQQPSSLTAVWSAFTSLVTTLVLVLNLYLAGLLLRPFQGAIREVQFVDEAGIGGSSSPVTGSGSSLAHQPGEPVDYGALKKAGLLVDSPFRIAGVFLHSVIVTGAYRSGPGRWAVVGLGATPLFKSKANCEIRCVWLKHGAGADNGTVSQSVKWDTPGINYKPGAYLTLTIDCLFSEAVGADGAGGALLLQVTARTRQIKVSYARPLVGWSGPADEDAWMEQDLGPRFYPKLAQEAGPSSPLQLVAVAERPHRYDPSEFSAPYRYQNLYCGSPLHVLHGNLSLSAVVEWLSYHYYLLGSRSHFVLHDAGAVRGDVRMQEALEPWINLGIVTVENVENLLGFDTFYYNQNLILNDCLHKYKNQAERLWFFDVDEYIVIRAPHTLQSLLGTFNSSVDVVKLKQLKFSDGLCRPESNRSMESKWNAERLFFRKEGDHPGEQKYVVLNPRVMLSTGIHDPFQSLHRGNRTLVVEVANQTGMAAYYHYHDTIMKAKSQLCLLPVAANASNGTAGTTGLASKRGFAYAWQYDDAILPQVAAAKRFIREFFAARNISGPGLPSLL